MFRAARRVVCRALLPVLTIALTFSVTAAPATASTAGDTVSYTNAARADRGLPRLAVKSDLASVAQRNAEWMASHRTLQHTSGLGSKVCCWRALGENVGYGSSARQVFNAWMGSSSHRANILSTRFTQVGVGVARGSDGYLYIDQVFRRPTGATSSIVAAPSAPRVSRSTTRTPLHAPTVAPAPRSQPTAEQLRLQKLAIRVERMHRPPGADPLRRSMLWVQVMSRVTAR